jgi:hypothetical protein
VAFQLMLAGIFVPKNAFCETFLPFTNIETQNTLSDSFEIAT